METKFNPNLRIFDKDGNELFGFWWWEQETTVFDTSKMDKPMDEE
ncbi:hypothetical protein [Acetivibrio straminisolvens]|jgi:hypothetical protein|nr:hypothetical protein [Acetivibrio straminisolvens]